jgi:hypothetical protein
MPKATSDEFELDIHLQDARPDELAGGKYPPPTAPIFCHTSTFCDF